MKEGMIDKELWDSVEKYNLYLLINIQDTGLCYPGYLLCIVFVFVCLFRAVICEGYKLYFITCA